ncbi:choloylglycine hydrolase family protein [Culicoidibacter larvae]|uniref:Choloylglycine hydrolase family protein n=1 Tax=Culicoidibacter larvae TaxID=2579976 RepID=A0A5R8QCL7_9FIRM|nr:choloylglycine hydrolase family protein [Culicoidibacter larvae]TLG74309.1 choloylglycine hydrolase family protein [Culicoidibacter larvae]
MCTSITFKTDDQINMLARTMDFALVLDPVMTMMPRNYHWQSLYQITQPDSQFAFAGLSRSFDGHNYVFADGINEAGLACAVLYFPGYASYSESFATGKINLAPHEVVQWLLSSFNNLEDVKEAVTKLHLIDTPLPFLGTTPPLHWIVTDESGASIVIEPLAEGIKVYDNPIGVMTNSPDFNWHLTNIRNYIGIRPEQLTDITINGTTFKPFGQGAGTFGLPGDFTPPARFIRTVFNRHAMRNIHGEEEAIKAVYHILASVDIPRGSVITAQDSYDFTQHTACMVCQSRTYYFKTYDNNQINKLELMKENLEGSEPLTWSVPKEQNYHHLNG